MIRYWDLEKFVRFWFLEVFLGESRHRLSLSLSLLTCGPGFLGCLGFIIRFNICLCRMRLSSRSSRHCALLLPGPCFSRKTFVVPRRWQAVSAPLVYQRSCLSMKSCQFGWGRPHCQASTPLWRIRRPWDGELNWSDSGNDCHACGKNGCR